MKSGLLIFFFIFFLMGCKSRNKIPKNILAQGEMKAVLWDMFRADKFLTDFIFKDSSLNKDTASTNLYKEVFRIHHITKEKFQQSFSFYRAHPDLLKTILDSLNSRPPRSPTEVHQFHSVADTAHLFEKARQRIHSKN